MTYVIKDASKICVEIQFRLSGNKNHYPDSDSKRLHLKGIDAAIEYLWGK